MASTRRILESYASTSQDRVTMAFWSYLELSVRVCAPVVGRPDVEFSQLISGKFFAQSSFGEITKRPVRPNDCSSLLEMEGDLRLDGPWRDEVSS